MTDALPAPGPRPRAFLGMPGYGDVSAGAARGFYLATAGGLEVRREYAEGSLATANMNRLWCTALNDAKNGGGLKYFAMQHADVIADDHWLDELVAELETRRLDVLGVVIPIKDSLGLTSTAIQRPDGDNWRPWARLSMAEAHRLPETFTSEDLGYPVLINTGLWVCRFDLAWAPRVYFTVNDRIMIDRRTGDYVVQCESEDWFASRIFHELGLKVGVTRKVKVGHQGKTIYGNHRPFGEWDCDRDGGVKEPIVADPLARPAAAPELVGAA